MNRLFGSLLLLFTIAQTQAQIDFKIAFGSCNDQKKENVFWNDILKMNPNLWIWGGDNIYSDTKNASIMKENYQLQLQQKEYKKVTKKIPIIGTWDDHDYGKNDGGVEYGMKKESQQLFLDFLNISKTHELRTQQGIYHSKIFNHKKGSIKVIILDTRYHRSALIKDETLKKNIPNINSKATILGTKQWLWLGKELTNSKADFTIIVSSIQVISSQHRFEKWGNFPHERAKLLQLIKTSKANNVVIISGDRHISEFSKTIIDDINYPIIDFTSSGLTHAYRNFKGEENRYREGKVIFTESYGLLSFNFLKKKITFQMLGKGNTILQEINQIYP